MRLNFIIDGFASNLYGKLSGPRFCRVTTLQTSPLFEETHNVWRPSIYTLIDHLRVKEVGIYSKFMWKRMQTDKQQMKKGYPIVISPIMMNHIRRKNKRKSMEINPNPITPNHRPQPNSFY